MSGSPSELFLAKNDFIELYNPAPLPVALGGLYLSNAEGAPGLNQIPALSFIAPNGYASFTADGDVAQGADHLNFKLDAEVGIIILSDPALTTIDAINYGPQQTDVAQGRSPSGSDTLVSFSQPTPGSPNPTPNGTITVTNVSTVILPLLIHDQHLEIQQLRRHELWAPPGARPATTTSPGAAAPAFSVTKPLLPNTLIRFIPTFLPRTRTAARSPSITALTSSGTPRLTNFSLLATNYVDDGAVYYLNGSAGWLLAHARHLHLQHLRQQPAERRRRRTAFLRH